MNEVILKIENLSKQYYIEFIVFFIASLIVLANIGRESLWLDEIFSAIAVSQSTSLKYMFIKFIGSDGNPPMYYLMLFYWSKIIGYSDVSLRLLSFVITIIGFLISYRILKNKFTHRIALIYLSLSVFTPGVLYFAQEMRSYALLYSIASLLSVLYTVFIKTKHKNTIIKLLFLYFVLGLFISLTHHYGTLLIFSISVSLIFHYLLNKRFDIAFNIYIVSCLIAIFPISWFFYQYYFQNLGNLLNTFSILPIYRSLITNIITLFAVNKYGAFILILLFIPFLKNIKKFKFVVGKNLIFLLPIVILILASYIFTIFTHKVDYRYFVVSIPLMLIFITFLFNDFYENKNIFIIVYIFTLMILSTYKNFTYQKQDFKNAAAFIKKNYNPNSCVIPINNLKDGSFNKYEFISYYIGNQYKFLNNGPMIQKDCDLIYIDIMTNQDNLKKLLKKYGILQSYKILNFNKVFIIVKKND